MLKVKIKNKKIKNNYFIKKYFKKNIKKKSELTTINEQERPREFWSPFNHVRLMASPPCIAANRVNTSKKPRKLNTLLIIDREPII
jgi:hypothetical protein